MKGEEGVSVHLQDIPASQTLEMLEPYWYFDPLASVSELSNVCNYRHGEDWSLLHWTLGDITKLTLRLQSLHAYWAIGAVIEMSSTPPRFVSAGCPQLPLVARS